METIQARRMSVKEIVDWSMAQDFADEIQCYLIATIGRGMDQKAVSDLTDGINLLIEKAVNEVIHG